MKVVVPAGSESARWGRGAMGQYIEKGNMAFSGLLARAPLHRGRAGASGLRRFLYPLSRSPRKQQPSLQKGVRHDCNARHGVLSVGAKASFHLAKSLWREKGDWGIWGLERGGFPERICTS